MQDFAVYMFEDKKFSEVYRLLVRDGLDNYNLIAGYRLGLDFGTSFTKVSYLLNGDSGRIPFSLGENTIPSIVYFNENNLTLSIFNSTSDQLKQIHYFKATMVENKEFDILKEKKIVKTIDDKNLREKFEFLCSVFFIANIINYSSLYVSKLYGRKSIPSLTMGIPMSVNNSNAPIYNKAIHTAWYVLNESFGKDISVMPLSYIYDVYKKNSGYFDNNSFDPKKPSSRNITIPEVVTEMNYLLNLRSIPLGYYCIIDIGGGTADFAFITKEELILHKDPRFDCKYALVRELGDQVRKKYKIAGKCALYESKFCSAFNECCWGAKYKMGKKGAMLVRVYLLGGGVLTDGNYYESILTSKENLKLLDSMNVDIEVILPENGTDARHIIADQLAQSDHGLKMLAGIPMN